MAEKKETKKKATNQKQLNKIRAKNYEKKFSLDTSFEDLVKLSVSVDEPKIVDIDKDKQIKK